MSSFLMLLGPHRFRVASGLELLARPAGPVRSEQDRMAECKDAPSRFVVLDCGCCGAGHGEISTTCKWKQRQYRDGISHTHSCSNMRMFQRQCCSAFNTYTDRKRSAPNRRCKWVCKESGKMHCGWQGGNIGQLHTDCRALHTQTCDAQEVRMCRYAPTP